ncbi:MAG: hypothetical protein HGA19_11875 [Oscillochloris sp.]|nr:hypothetical protein [Oscillochloris sp.]
MITAYLLFGLAALLMLFLVALIWRFWATYAHVSPEEEKLDRSIASLNDHQANRVSDEQIIRKMDTDTGWEIMVRRGRNTEHRRRK